MQAVSTINAAVIKASADFHGVHAGTVDYDLVMAEAREVARNDVGDSSNGDRICRRCGV